MAGGGLDAGRAVVAFGLRLPDVALVLVSANRGAGKTTLLRQWYEQSSSRPDHRTSSFEVEADDNDPDHFRARLGSVIGSETMSSTVFIDDFDQVQSSASRRVLVDLAEREAASTRFVVAQRPTNSLPVARLRADGLVVEFGDVELRLDDRHLEQLLEGRRQTVDDDGRAQLLSGTEGWASGIVTVLEQLEAAADEPEGELIDRTLRALGQDMVETIRSAVDADDYALVAGTSILDELEPGLCRHVVGAQTAIDLEGLAARTPFLSRVGSEFDRFRLHGLARRALLADLTAHERPEAIVARHRSAADWLEANGAVVAAFSHSLRADLPERAADLLAVRWSTDESAVDKDDLDAVDDHKAGDYVPHIVTTALVSLHLGCQEGLDRANEKLAGAEWIGPLPHGFATLDAARVTLSGNRLQHQGEADLERISTVMAREVRSGAESKDLAAQTTVAAAFYLLGRFEEARTQAEAVLLGHRSVGRHSASDMRATVGASDLCALLDYDVGDPTAARRHLRHSDELEATYDIPMPPETTPPAIGDRRLVRAVVGDDTVAVRIAELDRLSRDGSPAVQLHAAIELVRLLDSTRQVNEALDVLARTKASIDDIEVPPLHSQRLQLLADSLVPETHDSMLVIPLTDGERSVLYLLADADRSQSEISLQLGVSINTVKSHVRSIYQKFGVTGRSDAVARAGDLGLLVTVLPWVRTSTGVDSHPG